jgi:hypothetical protein
MPARNRVARTDEQILAILDDTGEWSVHDHRGRTLYRAASLRDAIREAMVYQAATKARISVFQRQGDVAVPRAQILRLAVEPSGTGGQRVNAWEEVRRFGQRPYNSALILGGENVKAHSIAHGLSSAASRTLSIIGALMCSGDQMEPMALRNFAEIQRTRAGGPPSRIIRGSLINQGTMP